MSDYEITLTVKPPFLLIKPFVTEEAYYWLINPFDETVLAEVRESGGYASQRLASGRLTSRVVPGFWIEVSWLWQDPLPSTFTSLHEIFASV